MRTKNIQIKIKIRKRGRRIIRTEDEKKKKGRR